MSSEKRILGEKPKGASRLTDLLQRVFAFLLSVRDSDKATDEQRQQAEQLADEVAQELSGKNLPKGESD